MGAAKKLINLKDLPSYPAAAKKFGIGIGYIKGYLNEEAAFLEEIGKGHKLDLNPDFQRGHVWTKEQQSGYIEHLIKGGTEGKNICFNNPSYDIRNESGDIVCIDGLQRLTTILDFFEDKVLAHGNKYSAFDVPSQRRIKNINIEISIYVYTNKKDILDHYLQINEGGTPHSADELKRVKSIDSLLMNRKR